MLRSPREVCEGPPAAERATGLVLEAGVRIGEDVSFGPHVTVQAGTVVGDGCVIEAGAVLGKRPRLAATSSAPRDEPDPLVLEQAVTVCAGAIVFAGAHIGPGAIVGDQSYIRERARIGAGSGIGRG